jgi:hypothetical protein
VQLLAETAVDMLNDSDAKTIDSEILEAAFDKAIINGDTVLRQLMRGESSEADWQYLRGFRTRDSQSLPDDETVYESLRRRMLVIEEQDEWRLRVPLMRRWLSLRG